MTAAAKDEHGRRHTPCSPSWQRGLSVDKQLDIKMSCLMIRGKIYVPESECRAAVNMALKTNEPKNAKIAALAAEVERLRYTLGLVLVGLKNGHVKAKPIFAADFTAETMQPQSLEQIIEAALARQEAP